MNYLCDTNILSELVRARPNRGVLEWAGQVKVISLSVVTVEEIAYGLSAKPNAKVQAWFDEFNERHCQILPITEVIAQRGGALRGKLRRQGQTRSQADMLIAATADQHQLTLVTRNTRDFDSCGIALLNPFS